MSFEVVVNGKTVEAGIATSGKAATAALKYIQGSRIVQVVRAEEGKKDKIVAIWLEGNKIK